MQVFEQDAHAFTRRLNGVLTPGPICYVAKIDSFVVGNSNMGVDCYKYQVGRSADFGTAASPESPKDTWRLYEHASLLMKMLDHSQAEQVRPTGLELMRFVSNVAMTPR